MATKELNLRKNQKDMAMNITIKGNGIKVRLVEDDSLLLMSSLYLFMEEHWNENANYDKDISKQIGLIQWLGNVFE